MGFLSTTKKWNSISIQERTQEEGDIDDEQWDYGGQLGGLAIAVEELATAFQLLGVRTNERVEESHGVELLVYSKTPRW